VIYAKVIGEIPNNQLDNRSIIKLSHSAAKALNVLDDRFIVDVEYVAEANAN
jgi:hypothetical protein